MESLHGLYSFIKYYIRIWKNSRWEKSRKQIKGKSMDAGQIALTIMFTGIVVIFLIIFAKNVFFKKPPVGNLLVAQDEDGLYLLLELEAPIEYVLSQETVLLRVKKHSRQ